MLNEGLMLGGARGRDFGLTPLEIQSIELIVNGHSHQESTARLGISQQELRLQLEGVCNKLSVSNQFELLLFALYYHLVDACVEPESLEGAHEMELTVSSPTPIQHT